MAPTLIFIFLLFGAQDGAQRVDLYETERSERVLKALGVQLDPEPLGKRVAYIRVLPYEVFDEDEPWPLFLNNFHVRTRDEVVRRELLFGEGEAYDAERVKETARNLRSMAIFSLVKIMPVQTDQPDEVGLIVFTRDLWSLRLEQAFQLTGSQVDMILLQLTERNLFGRGKLATLRFQLFPVTFWLGQFYHDRRLWGSSLSFFESLDLVFNRETGEGEGSAGQFWFGKPLYALRQSWSYGLFFGYEMRLGRQIQSGRLLSYDIPETTDQVEEIPRIWQHRDLGASATTTYQSGQDWKQQVSGGVGWHWKKGVPTDETGLLDEQRAAFERDVVPREIREFYPMVSCGFFEPVYYSFKNLSTFGQSEDVRIGPSLSVALRTPLALFGSLRDSVGVGLGAGYVYGKAETLAQASMSVSSMREDGEWINQVLGLGLRGATPHVSGIRMAARLRWSFFRNDKENTLISLGGNNGLRAYPSQAFQDFGASSFLGNFELRSRPGIYRSVHVGTVLFYDAGSVYQSLSTLRVHQSIGVGVRILLPQLNRFAYRLDVGVPLEGKGVNALLMIGRGQALPLTTTDDMIAP